MMKNMGNREAGLTIAELIVTLFILSIVMAATFSVFITLSKSFKSETKIAESNIESSLSIELVRRDLEMAGFGLPTGAAPILVAGGTYSEAVTGGSANYTDYDQFMPQKYTPDPTTFNDATNNEPRAVVLSNDTNPGDTVSTFDDSDVLSVKSQLVGNDTAAYKWTIRYYDAVSASWKNQLWNDPARDFCPRAAGTFTGDPGCTDKDRIIVVTSDTKSIFKNASSQYGYTVQTWPDNANTNGLPDPAINNIVYLIYGVYTKPSMDTSTVRMPFNRVDYYLQRPLPNAATYVSSFPSRCHPKSYTLYRTTINQSDGKRNEQPILDCVADFQVAIGLDTNANGAVDTWITESGATVASKCKSDTVALGCTGTSTDISTALLVRSKVKQVKVFALTHEGKFDNDFYYDDPANPGTSDPTVPFDVNFTGEDSLAYTLAVKTYHLNNLSNYIHYRWKLLVLDVKTANIFP
ncbi:MAG: PilW family protein [Nitrospirae bacterium]|nr:PilW family protein [Nitrospirota bacterium]